MARKPKQVAASEDSNSESESEYEVESIKEAKVDTKKARTIRWKFLVKWKGYGESDNTWEPPESFTDPKSITSFFKRCDLRGRNTDKPADWVIGEKVLPKSPGSFAALAEDDSDTDADGETDDVGDNGIVRQDTKASASAPTSPKPKRKRGPPQTTYSTPGRKRGRLSKSETQSKASTRSASTAGRRTKQGVNGAAARKGASAKTNVAAKGTRSSARISNKTVVADSSSDEDGETEHDESASAPPSRSELTVEIPARKRAPRAVVESDEEDDGEGEDDDHNSLFSGEGEISDKDEANANGTVNKNKSGEVSNSASKGAATGGSKLIRSRPTPIIRSGRRRESKIIMFEDPEVERTLRERLERKKASESGTSKYKPTLLTAQKGQLTSQRRMAMDDSAPKSKSKFKGMPPPNAFPEPEPADNDGPAIPVGDTEIIESGGLASAVSAISSTSAMEIDEIVTSLQDDADSASPSAANGTQPELTPGLADLTLGMEFGKDLENFKLDDSERFEVSTVSEDRLEEVMSRDQESEKESTVLKSTITQVQVTVEEASKDPEQIKAAFILHIRDGYSLPLSLKNMYHRFYAESCLRDLLSEGPKATAGRIYDGDAMFLLHGSLKMYGIAARVVLEPETSVQQQEVFSKLVKELENGSCLIVQFGDSRKAILFSSTNKAASELFGKDTAQKTDNIWGIPGAVVFQQVEVTDSTLLTSLAGKMSKQLRLE